MKITWSTTTGIIKVEKTLTGTYACSSCHERKPASEFSRRNDPNQKNRPVQYVCRACNTAYQKEYRKKRWNN